MIQYNGTSTSVLPDDTIHMVQALAYSLMIQYNGTSTSVLTDDTIHIRVFLGKFLRGGKPMFQEIEGGHWLELKYVIHFVASASLAYSSCLILHSVCAN